MMHLPKSAFVVLDYLVKDGPLSPHDISKKSQLAPRTVSYALRKLIKTRLCKKTANLHDMRRPLYSPNFEVVSEVVQRLGSDSLVGSQLSLIFRR